MQEKKTVGQSIASLVLGILSFIMFGLFAAIPAVICGHIAKSKIKADPENLKGDGQALAGLIMGYITIGITILMIPMLAAIGIPSFVKARDISMEKSCQNNLRIIQSAKEQCAMVKNLTDGAAITEESIGVYIKGDFSVIQCLKQGVITINPIGVNPDCSVHDFPEQY